MANRKRRGIIASIETMGEVETHMNDWSGNYATLCGMDGADDHPSVQQRVADTPPGAKITCDACRHIWEIAKQYRASDFVWPSGNER